MVRRHYLAETENYLAGLLHYISDRVELIGYEHGELLDFSKGMCWKIRYKIPEYALPVDGGFEFKSPLMQFTSHTLFRQASYNWPEKRRDDVFFYTTMLLDGSESIKLPGGYKMADAKESKEIDETYAYFKGEGKMAKNRLIIKQTAEIRRRQIPPDGYDGFRKAMKEAGDYAETVFRVEKGGAK